MTNQEASNQVTENNVGNPNKETPEQELRDILFELWRDGRSDNDRYNSVNRAGEKIATHYRAREAEIAKEAEIALARKVLAVSSGVPKLRGFTQAKRLKLLTAKMNEIIPDSGLFITEESPS